MAVECPNCGSEHETQGAMLKHHSKAHPEQWEDRYWYRVSWGDEDECWEWTGGVSGNGYGKMMIGGEPVPAHQIAVILDGREVGDGFALHECDNPLCQNPAHLYVGDAEDNAQDRERRNRADHAKGEDHGMAKITEEDVREIKDRLEGGEPQYSIAEDYPISRAMVSRINTGQKWSHVE